MIRGTFERRKERVIHLRIPENTPNGLATVASPCLRRKNNSIKTNACDTFAASLFVLSIPPMPKLNPESPLRALMETFPRAGKLEWIGLRPARRAPLQSFNHVEVLTDYGLVGDHKSQRAGGKRQVSLIQREHLDVVALLLGRENADPALIRRNLVISGINLLALRDAQFEIGGVVFEGTGLCEPCSRMEEVLGVGGYNAMRGHGGIIARVLSGGVIRVGEAVAYKKIPA